MRSLHSSLILALQATELICSLQLPLRQTKSKTCLEHFEPSTQVPLAAVVGHLEQEERVSVDSRQDILKGI